MMLNFKFICFVCNKLEALNLKLNHIQLKLSYFNVAIIFKE